MPGVALLRCPFLVAAPLHANVATVRMSWVLLLSSFCVVVRVVVVITAPDAVEDRKEWLRGFKAGTHADYNVESVTYESFINKELILFSVSVLHGGERPDDVVADSVCHSTAVFFFRR